MNKLNNINSKQDHILACLSSAPSNAKIIRTAARMAKAFDSQFTALFVETPDFAVATDENKKRLEENRKLAEQLGATIETVYGDDIPYQIAEFDFKLFFQTTRIHFSSSRFSTVRPSVVTSIFVFSYGIRTEAYCCPKGSVLSSARRRMSICSFISLSKRRLICPLLRKNST
jgi:hypothetical protein